MRFPGLKIALSEGEIGWIPYFLERAQQVYDTDYGEVTADPHFKCLPMGVPRQNAPTKIVQTGKEIILANGTSSVRFVPTDGRKRDEIDFLIPPENPECHQPGRMNRHDQRIMPRADFDSATRKQGPCIAAGKNELAQPLQRHQNENDSREAHAACRSTTQLAVKPGPSAVRSARVGKPCARARSRTNSTVGADILP